MRRAAIDIEKIVLWAIGILVLLVILGFMIAQFNPSSEGGVIARLLGALGLG